MANGDIVIRCETRPCYVDGRKAIWHCWSNQVILIQHSPTWQFEIERRRVEVGKDFEERDRSSWAVTMALVEYEDGTVDEVIPTKVKFADHGAFCETAWE